MVRYCTVFELAYLYIVLSMWYTVAISSNLLVYLCPEYKYLQKEKCRSCMTQG